MVRFKLAVIRYDQRPTPGMNSEFPDITDRSQQYEFTSHSSWREDLRAAPDTPDPLRQSHSASCSQCQ